MMYSLGRSREQSELYVRLFACNARPETFAKTLVVRLRRFTIVKKKNVIKDIHCSLQIIKSIMFLCVCVLVCV